MLAFPAQLGVLSMHRGGFCPHQDARHRVQDMQTVCGFQTRSHPHVSGKVTHYGTDWTTVGGKPTIFCRPGTVPKTAKCTEIRALVSCKRCRTLLGLK